MSKYLTIERALYLTAHRGSKDLYQLAEEIGAGYNNLSRAVSDSDSGINFPLRWLAPLMKAANNYSVLHRIANICGFLLVRMPRGVNKFKKIDRQVNDYQKDFAEAISTLLAFINDPTENNYKDVNERLLSHMAETEFWRQRCKKNLTNQTDMFGETENE